MAIYFDIYIYLHTQMILNDMINYDMDFHRWVMLRSTTGPYGRPMIEVAYGEMMYFTPPRLYGREKLGKSGWGVDMMHRPCLTYPGQHQCGHSILFSGFKIYKKTYIFILFCKIYM